MRVTTKPQGNERLVHSLLSFIASPRLQGVAMNRDQMKGKWHQLKGAAKVQWSKLTDDDVNRGAGEAESSSASCRSGTAMRANARRRKSIAFSTAHQVKPPAQRTDVGT